MFFPLESLGEINGNSPFPCTPYIAIWQQKPSDPTMGSMWKGGEYFGPFFLADWIALPGSLLLNKLVVYRAWSYFLFLGCEILYWMWFCIIWYVFSSGCMVPLLKPICKMSSMPYDWVSAIHSVSIGSVVSNESDPKSKRERNGKQLNHSYSLKTEILICL